MTYKTKYDIDDTVFLMIHNKIVEGSITKILIKITDCRLMTISYTLVSNDYNERSMFQSELFTTKADLLATL